MFSFLTPSFHYPITIWFPNPTIPCENRHSISFIVPYVQDSNSFTKIKVLSMFQCYIIANRNGIGLTSIHKFATNCCSGQRKTIDICDGLQKRKLEQLPSWN
jgi:hypothetical protein